jgi:hypothetical protein
MKLFVCAEPGLKDPTRRYILNKIKEWGYHGTRTDVARDPEIAKIQIRRYSRRDMRDLDVIFLIAGGKMRLNGTGPALEPAHIATLARRAAKFVEEFEIMKPGRLVAFEIGNEPDIAVEYYKRRPEKFAEAVRLAAKAIRSVIPNAPIISGGISNLHRDRLRYLEKALQGLPNDIIPGFHRYKTETRADVPIGGYRSRDEEVAELLRVTAGWPVPWHTEGGNHDRIQRVKTGIFGWSRKEVQKTEIQVAADNEFDVELFHSFGIPAFTKYQIRDGLPGDPYDTEGGFGDIFTEPDGSPGRDKITATRVKEWRKKYSSGRSSFTVSGG